VVRMACLLWRQWMGCARTLAQAWLSFFLYVLRVQLCVHVCVCVCVCKCPVVFPLLTCLVKMCEKCGGLVSAERRGAHELYWCEAAGEEMDM
jgi:hypothetical protein